MAKLALFDFFISLLSSIVLFFVLKILGLSTQSSYIVSIILFGILFMFSFAFSFYLQKIQQKIIFLNSEIERLRKFDELTDVYNRDFLLENLKKYFEISKIEKLPLSFIIVRIDNFENFLKEDIGKGNFILKEVSKTLKNSLQEMDLIGRFGVDEFLIATFLNKKEALNFAFRLHNELKKLNIQINIGVAQRNDFDSINDLLRKAQEAVYLAQIKGGNRVDVLEHFLLIE